MTINKFTITDNSTQNAGDPERNKKAQNIYIRCLLLPGIYHKEIDDSIILIVTDNKTNTTFKSVVRLLDSFQIKTERQNIHCERFCCYDTTSPWIQSNRPQTYKNCNTQLYVIEMLKESLPSHRHSHSDYK